MPLKLFFITYSIKSCREEYFMTAQKLVSDLAIAERNTKHMLKYHELNFAEEIREIFEKYKVSTYLDLVEKYPQRCLELRALAIKENLI